METPTDDFANKLASIEQQVNRRFEDIEQSLETLKNDVATSRQHVQGDEERFLRLCHSVDYLLELCDPNYDTLACREMVLTMLGQRSARPFSGRTIRNRLLCKRIKRWCFFVVLISFAVVCMSFYGLHRQWCYLFVLVCLMGSILSAIGIRRIYKIVDVIW